MDTIFIAEQTDLVNSLISTLYTHNNCVDIKYETNDDEEVDDDDYETPDVQIWWLVKPDFADIIEELNLTSFRYKGCTFFGQTWWGASLEMGLRYSGIFERLPFLNPESDE